MYIFSQLKEDSTRFLRDFLSLCLSGFQDKIIYNSYRRLSCAVVAQPGRALDQCWGEAEDRAVVSSNLTDGIYGLP